MTEQEQFQKTIGKLEAALNMRIFALAMQGCSARQLYILGEESRAVDAIRGNEPLTKALMALAHDYETRIRNGADIIQALDDMRAAGWLNRIDNLQAGE